ncbi:unnamed protein product [Polarella glacialis]|uniref:Uncharacterized protein n=1 Tax=Polarella glacialis TaxID=89957 RepID=A0A813GWA8_POLGL|nr:unnamed protein product [Polarella glacialis]
MPAAAEATTTATTTTTSTSTTTTRNDEVWLISVAPRGGSSSNFVPPVRAGHGKLVALCRDEAATSFQGLGISAAAVAASMLPTSCQAEMVPFGGMITAGPWSSWPNYVQVLLPFALVLIVAAVGPMFAGEMIDERTIRRGKRKQKESKEIENIILKNIREQELRKGAEEYLASLEEEAEKSGIAKTDEK